VNGACPPAGELERLLANELSKEEEAALDNHVARCELCQRRLDELTRFAPKIDIIIRSIPFDARVAGAIPLDVRSAASENGNANGARGHGGVLARLANSSRPALRLVGQNGSEAQTPSASALRRLGNSSAIAASGRFLVREYWIWPLIVAALLGGAGWWVSRSVESALRQQRITELNMVLDADLAALRGWMNNQRAIAQLIADDARLVTIVQELLAVADGTPAAHSRLVQSPAQAEIRPRLARPMENLGFTGFHLISPSGIALALDGDAPVGRPLEGPAREFFAKVYHGQPAVSKPFLSALPVADRHGEMRAERPCMYAAAPIHDEKGRPIAVLGLRIRPEEQFTRILQVARSGSSGETYAFDREGLLLTQSRFDDGLKQVGLLVDRPRSTSILTVALRDPGVNMMAGKRPTTRREDQQFTRMARAALQGQDGFDVDGYRDYRGVPVVGAWKWLEEHDFGVATEVDVAEAFALASILRDTFALLMGLLVATSIGILLAMLHIARQQRKLRAVTSAVQQLGQYTLVESLGTGGMGTVYKARHALLRRPTAVKLLNPEKISDAAIARFEREVQLTSGLTHPHTVGIYDYGRTPEGVFYYAMEYLEGVNLDELVMRYGPLPDERVVYILSQICGSLAEAHAAGLIHRDVKPANVFLTLRGGEHDFVKVLDFGLAKVANDHDAKITSLNTMTGTPLYVAPETITHPERVDARTDVYAIGAVGYFLITGTPVFSASAVDQICLMHLGATPEPPSVRADRPVIPELEALLLRCLAKSQSDRPKDAADLLRQLEKCPVPCRWTSTDAARWWLDKSGGDSAAVRETVVRETAVRELSAAQ
jgi:hypothetical protein